MPLEREGSGHVLVDVLDRVLDKGIVIDAAVRISVVGIELLGVDARVVVASIETYLLHADTLAYTDLAARPRPEPVPPPADPEGGSAPPSVPDALLAPVPPESKPPLPPLYAEPATREGLAPDHDPDSNSSLAASPGDDDPDRKVQESTPDIAKPSDDS